VLVYIKTLYCKSCLCLCFRYYHSILSHISLRKSGMFKLIYFKLILHLKHISLSCSSEYSILIDSYNWIINDIACKLGGINNDKNFKKNLSFIKQKKSWKHGDLGIKVRLSISQKWLLHFHLTQNRQLLYYDCTANFVTCQYFCKFLSED
jgi:hypothetical protein